ARAPLSSPCSRGSPRSLACAPCLPAPASGTTEPLSPPSPCASRSSQWATPTVSRAPSATDFISWCAANARRWWAASAWIRQFWMLRRFPASPPVTKLCLSARRAMKPLPRTITPAPRAPFPGRFSRASARALRARPFEWGSCYPTFSQKARNGWGTLERGRRRPLYSRPGGRRYINGAFADKSLARDRLRLRRGQFRCAQSRRALHRVNHGVCSDARVQQHVVEPARAPLLLVELANDPSAPPIEGRQMLLRLMRPLRKRAREPILLGAGRGVHENMKASRPPGEGTGRSAANQHAVALIRSVEDLCPDQFQHALGVEDFLIAAGGRRIHIILPEHFAVTVIPGVQPLVEPGRRLRIDAGDARRASHQLRVQQPPAQPRRQIVRKLRSVRAVLTLHGDHPDRRMHHDPE